MKLTHDWLIELGIVGLDDATAQSLLAHIRDTLEERVGERLAANLTDAQLEEFENINDSGDMDAAQAWLSTNCPDYQQVVQHEITSIGEELRSSSQQISES